MSLTARTRSGRVSVARPNWRQPVSVSYQFRTSLLSSYDDTEQRESLRASARVKIEYQSILTGPMFTRWTADRQDPISPLVVAATWRRVTTTAAVVAGASVLAVDATPAWIVPGATLVLTNDTHEEAVVVSAVGLGSVTVIGATVFAYAAGASLHLGYLALPDQDTDFQAESDAALVGSLTFDVRPGTDPQIIPGAVWPTFEGRPVFDRAPNWRSRPSVTLRDLRNVFDPGRGDTLITVPVERLTAMNKYGFSGFSVEAVDDLIAFFLDRRGRRNAFWMPTHLRDLEVLSATLTTITVAGREAFDAFAGRDAFNCIAVLGATGAWEGRRVASWALSGGNTLLTLSAALGASPSVFSKVSWLHLCRFAADQLEVRYQTDSVAEVEFAIESLKNEAP